MEGHLYVVQTDLRRLACDVWLLPTDPDLVVSVGWGEDWQGRVAAWTPPAGWGDGVRAARLAKDSGREVWAGCTGGISTDDFDWYRAALDQYLDGVKEISTTRALPLVALPAVGVGAGGQGKQKWTVLPPLVSYLREEAKRRRIDIVLADTAPDVVAAVQATRREGSTWPDLDPAHVVRAKELGETALKGHLVVFVGAGVSQGAGLPGWRDLLSQLAEAVGIADPQLSALEEHPLDWARVIESRLGGAEPQTLRRTIVEIMRSDVYALAHAQIASLPITQAATTNYDTLLEDAARATHQPFAVLPYQAARNASRWLLKLHGSVEHSEDVVVTRQDYLRYADRRGALAGILQALLVTQEMLFVGFSLDDDNFHRIADEIRKALSSTVESLGTAVALDHNEVTEAIWGREIEFLSMGGEEREAVRRVNLFLDCVGHHASLGGAHLLDPTFSEMLSEEERVLAEQLTALTAMRDHVKQLPAWTRVEELLHELGASAP